MSMIRTENLCKSFHSLEVLKDVSLTVEPGEVVCIVGPSGAGKSTYLRSLNGLETINSGKIWIDDVLIEDRDKGSHVNKVKMPKQQRLAILLELGMVFQRFNLFPHLTALQNIMIAQTKVRKRGEAEAREKAESLLRRVGLSDKINEYPSKLSGGQQQRLAIASVIVMRPQVLVLDEPTSQLDPVGTREVFETLHRLARTGSDAAETTVVLAEHKLEWIAVHADRIILLDGGRIVHDGHPHDVLADPSLPTYGLAPTRYTQAARLAVTQGCVPADRPLPVTLDEAVKFFSP